MCSIVKYSKRKRIKMENTKLNEKEIIKPKKPQTF